MRFSPITTNPIIVSGGWDKAVKVWNLTNCKLKNNLIGHTGYVNTVTVSPDGSLCASGGKVCVKGEGKPAFSSASLGLSVLASFHTRCHIPHLISFPPLRPAPSPQDGVAMLWDLAEGKRLYSLDASDIIHCLVFSPNRYWLCAATQKGIKIWDLESKTLVRFCMEGFPL